MSRDFIVKSRLFVATAAAAAVVVVVVVVVFKLRATVPSHFC